MAYVTYLGGPLAGQIAPCGVGHPARVLAPDGSTMSGHHARRALRRDEPRYVVVDAPGPALLRSLTAEHPEALERRSAAPWRVYAWVPGVDPRTCRTCGQAPVSSR